MQMSKFKYKHTRGASAHSDIKNLSLYIKIKFPKNILTKLGANHGFFFTLALVMKSSDGQCVEGCGVCFSGNVVWPVYWHITCVDHMW